MGHANPEVLWVSGQITCVLISVATNSPWFHLILSSHFYKLIFWNGYKFQCITCGTVLRSINYSSCTCIKSPYKHPHPCKGRIGYEVDGEATRQATKPYLHYGNQSTSYFWIGSMATCQFQLQALACLIASLLWAQAMK